MILLLLAIILLVCFIYKPQHLPMFLVVYYVFYDMFDGFYKDEKVYALLRYLLPILLLLVFIVKYRVFEKFSRSFSVLIGYIFLLFLVNPGELAITSRTVMAIFITLFMVPVGIRLAEEGTFFKTFQHYNRLLLYALPLYIAFANYIGIEGYYSDAFSTGYLITSRMYVVPIVIFLGIYYLISGSYKNWLLKGIDSLFILINFCILIVNTRRTALGMIVVALLLLIWFYRHMLVRLMAMLFVICAGLFFSYPLYEGRLNAQLIERDRIQDLNTYQEEGRVLETLYIIDYHNRNSDFSQVLAGVRLFDTQRFGAIYFGKDRPIHSDINMIFYSTGLIGIGLFFWFLYSTFLSHRKRMDYNNRQLFYPLILMLCMVLVPGRFIGTMTYAPLLLLLLSVVKFTKDNGAFHYSS